MGHVLPYSNDSDLRVREAGESHVVLRTLQPGFDLRIGMWFCDLPWDSANGLRATG